MAGPSVVKLPAGGPPLANIQRSSIGMHSMKVTVSLRSRIRRIATHLGTSLRRGQTPGILLLLQLSLAGCAAIRGPALVVDRSRDAAIVSELQARLAAEPALAQSSFRVEADGGIILLHGSVEGLGAWRCALRNANLITGVITVADYLTIERGPRDIMCRAPRSLD